ncbi:unnamed protein product [Hapterophycus canaliculatus]
MIESCKHVYCKGCLFEWLEASDRCPLCKVFVRLVLHDIKCPREYTVHVHTRDGNGGGGGGEGGSSGEGFTPSSSRAATEAQSRGEGDGRGGGVGGKGAAFRPLVYRRGLAAEPPEQKARRPKSLGQLRPWIAREVQAATPSGGGGDGAMGVGGMDTRLVVDVVEALLKENDVDSQQGYCAVKEQLQGFLFENTAPFLHELWCFRWSKARMPAYDQDVVYKPREASRR